MKKIIIVCLMSWMMQSNAMVTSPIIGRKAEMSANLSCSNAYVKRSSDQGDGATDTVKQDQKALSGEDIANLVNTYIYWENYVSSIYRPFMSKDQYGQFKKSKFFENLVMQHAQADWERRNWKNNTDTTKKG